MPVYVYNIYHNVVVVVVKFKGSLISVFVISIEWSFRVKYNIKFLFGVALRIMIQDFQLPLKMLLSNNKKTENARNATNLK